MVDIRRSLEAFEIDEETQLVQLTSKTNEIFSMGTDLNYLYITNRNGEDNKVNEYLMNLYNFQNFIANYHKPLFCVAKGALSN